MSTILKGRSHDLGIVRIPRAVRPIIPTIWRGGSPALGLVRIPGARGGKVACGPLLKTGGELVHCRCMASRRGLSSRDGEWRMADENDEWRTNRANGEGKS